MATVLTRNGPLAAGFAPLLARRGLLEILGPALDRLLHRPIGHRRRLLAVVPDGVLRLAVGDVFLSLVDRHG